MRSCIVAEVVESRLSSSADALRGGDECLWCFRAYAFEIARERRSDERGSVCFAEPVTFQECLEGIQFTERPLVDADLELCVEFLSRRAAQAERFAK